MLHEVEADQAHLGSSRDVDPSGGPKKRRPLIMAKKAAMSMARTRHCDHRLHGSGQP
jgi:hypothetical protein